MKLASARSVLCAAALSALAVPSAQAAGDTPYMYQRTGFGEKGALALEWESAVGTREARPFGERGLEQGLRLRYGITGRVSVEAWGGVLFDMDEGGVEGGAFSAEANVGVLQQEKHFIDLSVGAGYLMDYQGVSVPRARLTASRDFGRVNVMVNGLAEMPLAENRDVVDLVIGTAAAYAIQDNLRVGVELVGEDLEGFWEEEEAEGGAKFVAGPSIWAAKGEHFEVKATTGVVVAATRNEPTRVDDEVVITPEAGFLGRVTLGVVF